MNTEMHTGEILVSWNPINSKERDEAKAKYQKARSEGRKIMTVSRLEIDAFAKVSTDGEFLIAPTTLNAGEWTLRIHDETGDRRLIWQSEDPDQVKEAATKFNEYMSKGWKAYAYDPTKPKDKGRRIYGFDGEREEIVFDDKNTLRENLKNFVKAFTEIKMVPKTYPG